MNKKKGGKPVGFPPFFLYNQFVFIINELFTVQTDKGNIGVSCRRKRSRPKKQI